MGLIKCLFYAACLGLASFLLGRILPKKWFRDSSLPFREYGFEQDGKLYLRFGIRRWQNHVPDMSRIFPWLMPPKKVTSDVVASLPNMITETCIAEWIHGLLCLLILPCLWIWPGWGGALFCLLYILGNLPYIMIQRYNRPRLQHLRNRLTQTRKDMNP